MVMQMLKTIVRSVFSPQWRNASTWVIAFEESHVKFSFHDVLNSERKLFLAILIVYLLSY